MAPPSTRPLVIRPRASRRLLLWLVAVHAAATGCALPLPLPAGGGALLVIAIGLSLGWQLWVRIFALAPWSIRAAVWSERGWVLELGDGRVRSARLGDDTWVGQDLVVLRFRDRRRSRVLAVSADAVEADLLRRLRARLRLIGAEAPGPATAS